MSVESGAKEQSSSQMVEMLLERDEFVVIARITGEIYSEDAGKFVEFMKLAFEKVLDLQGGKGLVLDMTQTEVICSAAFSTIIGSARELLNRKKRLSVAAGSEFMKKMWKVMHCNMIVPLVDSVKEAKRIVEER